MKSKKRFIFLIALFSLICTLAVSAAYYYYGSPGYGYGGWDWFNLAQLYDVYYEWFDFVIFLVIFIGLGKEVFGEHFKGGARGVYVGVGFLLALALVWFEEETGFSIIRSLGIYGVLLLGVIVFFVLFGLIKKATGSGIFSFSILYLAFYFIYRSVIQEYFYDFFYNLAFYAWNIDLIMLILNIGALAAGFGFVIGLIQLFQKEKK